MGTSPSSYIQVPPPPGFAAKVPFAVKEHIAVCSRGLGQLLLLCCSLGPTQFIPRLIKLILLLD